MGGVAYTPPPVRLRVIKTVLNMIPPFNAEFALCQNPEFKILKGQNPEFKIFDGQNPEFKILEGQNPELKILESQNPEFKILEA